jgi:hypothetical protein
MFWIIWIKEVEYAMFHKTTTHHWFAYLYLKKF